MGAALRPARLSAPYAGCRGRILSITSATVEPALLDLPWDLPLEVWPDETIAALPKGISRHIVRFVNLSGYVVAVKETSAELARREYDLLRTLERLAIPCVEPVAVITNRTSADGEPLESVLVTRHLRFSLPYRAVYSQSLRPETATRSSTPSPCCSCGCTSSGSSGAMYRCPTRCSGATRGAFAAYLVDAETGALYENGLSDGQRENDLEIGRVNIAGELLDLQSGGRLDEDIDPVAIADFIVEKYRSLWKELTGTEEFASSERWRINQRVERLNDLGFDIGELSMRTDNSGSQVVIQPKVVDAGHHSRRLLRLTGIDAQENQARRLLNDLDAYRVAFDKEKVDEEVVAHEWTARVFEPVIRAIPRELRGKLEPAEIFHQLLDHRWYLSQNENRDVPLAEAVSSYVDTVLRHRRDEVTVVNPPTGAMTVPIDIVDDEEEDWRTNV